VYVSENSHVLSGLSIDGLRWALTSFHASNWHPLTWLSFQLDASVWGRNPAGYHATNLLFHSVNVVLLFVVIHQLSNSVYRSACVAAIFAIHPLHVESVAWVTERKDVLSTFFLLLTLLAYTCYSTRPSVNRYLLVLVLYAFGLMAKPMLVTLPILMLLLDVWPLSRVVGSSSPLPGARFPRKPVWFLVVEKIPLLCLAFTDGLLTIRAQRDVVRYMIDLTFDTRLANMFNAYGWYVKKTFVPTNLTIFYPHPERDLSWALVGIGVIVFVLISGWVLWQRRTRPHLLFGWTWFVVALLPVIGLMQVGTQAYADRYAYIPHIGLLIAIVWELHARFVSTKTGRILGGVIFVAALVACGMLTRNQIGYWKNTEALWTHALDVDPNNGAAHAHLADVQIGKLDYEGALVHIERGMSLKRSGYVANGYCVWGRTLLSLNRPEEAEQKFLAALKVDRNNEGALDELAKLFRKQGRHVEADQVAQRHAQIMSRNAKKRPDSAASQMDLGLIQARQGNLQQAIVHFENAIRLAPQSAPAYFNLAYAQMDLKLFREAKSNLLKALELNPDLAVAHVSIADILESEKDIAGAKKHFAEALRIKPDDLEAKQGLDRLSKF
jgi:tetratricopeptide (TPR) repeat protein